MKPLYIFDLDGTLALTNHRQHFVDRIREKKDWTSFYAACVNDQPNEKVLYVMESLRKSADIWIFSGRSNEVRAQTVDWLAKHTSFTPKELEGPIMTMRAAGDYTADHVLKRQWFDLMLSEDQKRLVAVFDDRDCVVQMWRNAGVTCFQVANGDF